MIEKIRSLGKQTAVYGLGSILNKVLGFILIPVYQTHIPIHDFGYLVFFEAIIIFLSAFLSYGITVGHQRFFYLEKEKNTYGTFLFNNFIGCFILSTVSVLPMLLFSSTLAESITGASNQGINLQITLAIIIVELLYVLPLQVLQYERRPVSYLLYNAVKLLITFGITIYFVVSLKMGFTGFLLARLAGVSVILLISFIHVIIPRCTFRFDAEPLKKTLLFGFPHVISTIGYTIFTVTDRFMLQWLSTPDELGKYGFGTRIANFVNLIFIQTIGMSYFPTIMNSEKEEGNLRYYRKMLTYYCFILAILILGFLFYYKDLLWVVGKNKDYWEGLAVVPVLSLSFMVMGMNYFVQAGLFLKNKTQYYLIPSAAAIPVNIGLNLLLIPSFGMMGAALSVLTAQVTYTSILSVVSGRFMKINFEWGKVFLIMLLAISLYVLAEYIVIPSLLLQYLFKASLIAVLPVSLYYLGFFEPVEIEKLKKGIRRFFPLK